MSKCKRKRSIRKSQSQRIYLFIKDIPNSQNEISIYQNTNGPAIFVIDAYIFNIDIKSFAKSKSSLATMKVTDETDSIIVKKMVTNGYRKRAL